MNRRLDATYDLRYFSLQRQSFPVISNASRGRRLFDQMTHIFYYEDHVFQDSAGDVTIQDQLYDITA
jgi:predicted secreted hydrolase